MRLDIEEEQVVDNTTVDLTKIKCEPVDDLVGAPPDTVACNVPMNVIDVKPHLDEIVPAIEYSDPTDIDDIDPALKSFDALHKLSSTNQFNGFATSNESCLASTSQDIKPCIGSSHKMEIKVVREDIVFIEVDAVVNAVNMNLTSDATVIETAAGPHMTAELDELKKTLPKGVLSNGCCFATSPHGIDSCQAVFHTSVPQMSELSPNRMEEFCLRSCYLNCLAAGDGHGFTKMAFSLLGFDTHDSSPFTALIAIQAVLLHRELNPQSMLEEVIFVTTDERAHEMLVDVMKGEHSMAVGADAQRLRLEMERQHVITKTHRRISPVANSPLLVASFVKKWAYDSERKRVLRLANPPPKVEEKRAKLAREKREYDERVRADRLKKEQERCEAALRESSESVDLHLEDGSDSPQASEHPSEASMNKDSEDESSVAIPDYSEMVATISYELGLRSEIASEIERRKAVNRERNRRRLEDPQYRAKVNAHKREKMKDEEYRRKDRERRRQRMEDPEYRARAEALVKARRGTEEYRKKCAERQAIKLADPAYREMLNARRRERRKDEAYRKREAARRQRIPTEEQKEKVRERRKTEEYRKKVAEQRRKRREEDSEYRERIAARKKAKRDEEKFGNMQLVEEKFKIIGNQFTPLSLVRGHKKSPEAVVE